MLIEMVRNRTAVLITYRKNRLNNYLRFGTPITTIRRNWHRSLAIFRPAQIFGYVRWRGDTYGTQNWHFYILQAACSGSITAINGVIPGADILLQTQGGTRTKRILQHLKELEHTGQNLDLVSENYWRNTHNLIDTGLDPRPITPLQRRSFRRDAQ